MCSRVVDALVASSLIATAAPTHLKVLFLGVAARALRTRRGCKRRRRVRPRRAVAKLALGQARLATMQLEERFAACEKQVRRFRWPFADDSNAHEIAHGLDDEGD